MDEFPILSMEKWHLSESSIIKGIDWTVVQGARRVTIPYALF